VTAQNENWWFFVFWGSVALVITIELLLPQFQEPADRTRRWPTNFGLGILNGLIVSAVPILTVSAAKWAADHDIGLLNWMGAPWWVMLPGTLLVTSLAQYALHIASHKSSLLWKLHRVHHCDVHLDISSAFRTHPLEMLLGILFLVPIAVLFGLSPTVLAAYESVAIIVNMLTHANMKVPERIDSCAQTLLVTPSFHRLHHSVERAQTDSNYGNVITIWDRLFGTCSMSVPSENSVRFGLEEVSPDNAADFGYQLRLPWR
jgi:sterol desaturase/sphingolipid hydroxylase (fatty acid hydroxylase superfamily)